MKQHGARSAAQESPVTLLGLLHIAVEILICEIGGLLAQIGPELVGNGLLSHFAEMLADQLLPIPLWIAAGLSSSIVLVIFAVVLVESVPAIIDVGFLLLIVVEGWYPT